MYEQFSKLHHKIINNPIQRLNTHLTKKGMGTSMTGALDRPRVLMGTNGNPAPCRWDTNTQPAKATDGERGSSQLPAGPLPRA